MILNRFLQIGESLKPRYHPPILYFPRTAIRELQPDLTTIRESQSPIFAFDSKTRVTAVDSLNFVLSVSGNLSTFRLSSKSLKCPDFKSFSALQPHFFDSRTTVSTCLGTMGLIKRHILTVLPQQSSKSLCR